MLENVIVPLPPLIVPAFVPAPVTYSPPAPLDVKLPLAPTPSVLPAYRLPPTSVYDPFNATAPDARNVFPPALNALPLFTVNPFTALTVCVLCRLVFAPTIRFPIVCAVSRLRLPAPFSVIVLPTSLNVVATIVFGAPLTLTWALPSVSVVDPLVDTAIVAQLTVALPRFSVPPLWLIPPATVTEPLPQAQLPPLTPRLATLSVPAPLCAKLPELTVVAPALKLPAPTATLPPLTANVPPLPAYVPVSVNVPPLTVVELDTFSVYDEPIVRPPPATVNVVIDKLLPADFPVPETLTAPKSTAVPLPSLTTPLVAVAKYKV